MGGRLDGHWPAEVAMAFLLLMAMEHTKELYTTYLQSVSHPPAECVVNKRLSIRSLGIFSVGQIPVPGEAEGVGVGYV